MKTYGWKWERLRARHLRLNPHCAMCGDKALHVDHIIPIKLAPWRRLDPTNLQSLCHPCHNRITAAYDRGIVTGACDEDGLPLDPAHPWKQPNNAAAIVTANRDRSRPQPGLATRLKVAKSAKRSRND